MNRIKELRKKHGLTAKQLAESVGVSRGQIANIEIGLRKTNLQLAKRIANYFGLSIEDIFFVPNSHEAKQIHSPSRAPTGTE